MIYSNTDDRSSSSSIKLFSVVVMRSFEGFSSLDRGGRSR